jgi:lipopolysaccharide transport protein LptA
MSFALINHQGVLAAPKDAPIKLTAPSAAPKTLAATATASPSSSSPIGLTGEEFDLSKGPTNISADTLTIFSDKRTFTYKGKVVVVQGDMTLTSDILDGNYSEKNEIEMIIARSNVTITKGPDIKAGSQKAEYNAKLRTIILTEAPHIDQKGSVLTADLIKVFVDENRSVAEGNVKVSLTSTDDLKPSGAQ